MVKQTTVIHKADNGNRVKEEVVVFWRCPRVHDEKEQHAALQSRKDDCVKMTRNARIRERKRTQGGGQGDCQSEDRCRQCKAESVHVGTDLENVALCGQT